MIGADDEVTRLRLNVVGSFCADSVCGEGIDDATDFNAASSMGGSVRPRFSALRRIPRQAFAESEYFGDTSASRIIQRKHAEYPASMLGHSEPFCVQHSPPTMKPVVCQVPKDSREISSIVGREQSGNILEHQIPGSKLTGDSGEFVEESAACSTFESFPCTCNAEVLAWESADQHINARQVLLADFAYVIMARHVRPVPCEYVASGAVNLDLERALQPGTVKAEVEPAGSREQRAVGHFLAPFT